MDPLHHAPLGGAGGRAESALWLLAMAPDGDRFARRATFPVEGLVATADPFRLCLGGADLSDRGRAQDRGRGRRPARDPRRRHLPRSRRRPAYCYNSEVDSMRIFVRDRTACGRFGWTLRDTLVADGRAHIEYGRRATVADVELLLT